MAANFQKGDLLERAVRFVEEAILTKAPGVTQETLKIESKKLLLCAGVRHEIDLWVRVEICKGYGAIFIFECKNCEDRVGKNEVIVFSEKIDASTAQTGFFVAKAFTKDARAQAGKDSRIQLLQVASLPTKDLMTPFDFHSISMDSAKIDLRFTARSRASEPVCQRIQAQDIVFNGERIKLQDYANQLVAQMWEERSRNFPSGDLPEGLYPIITEGERRFEKDRLFAEDKDIERLLFKCEFNARVVRPAVVSYFDIQSRGRSFELAPIRIAGGGSLHVAFVGTPSSQDQ